MDVAVVTCAEEMGKVQDDTLLMTALAQYGLEAGAVAWDDARVDWSVPKVCVIRSTWDYHVRRDEFLRWAQKVARVSALWNPLQVVRWNTHKGYLRDLAERGVAIVPTVWLGQGMRGDLARIMQERGWKQVVVKPVVSADAYGTVLVTGETVGLGQQHLERFLESHDMMVQPFVATVQTRGERSLVYIDGEVTHAIRRVPMLGNNGVGRNELVEAEEDEVGFAHTVLKLVEEPILYARVDLIRDEDGVLRLMELELVEPGLWLELAPQAVERFAGAIARVAGRRDNS